MEEYADDEIKQVKQHLDDELKQCLDRVIGNECPFKKEQGRAGFIEVMNDPNVSPRGKLLAVYFDMCLSLARKIISLQNGGEPEQNEQIRAYINEFLEKSNYGQAARALGRDIPGNGLTGADAFLLTYFATHPNIQAYGEGQLTEADEKRIREQDEQFKTFFGKFLTEPGPIDEEKFMQTLEAFLKEEELPEIAQAIEHLNNVLPQKHIIPNNKLANTLYKLETDIETSLTVGTPQSTKVILIDENDKVKVSGRRPYTEYDRNVYNAVASLYAEGNRTTTPAIVCRAMAGKDKTERPTDEQIKAVRNSLDKMRFMRVQIDCTAELKARSTAWKIATNSRQLNRGVIDTYLLAAEAIKLDVGGVLTDGYRILRPPILYEYSDAVNQVLTCPTKMLDVKILDKNGKPTTRSLPNTKQFILIRGYLLRRIEGMRGNNNLKSNVIALYDSFEKDGETLRPGLYSIAGKPGANREEARRIREDVEAILSFWWKVYGFIKGYEIQTHGRKITGYKIDV